MARKSGEFALSLAVAVRDPERGFDRIVVGAADGPPLVLAEASRRIGAADLAEAIAADLDAAGRGFDEFRRLLHRTAALRAARQVSP